jgi:hypothetical protein
VTSIFATSVPSPEEARTYYVGNRDEGIRAKFEYHPMALVRPQPLSGRSQELSTTKNPNVLTLDEIGIWHRARLYDVDAEPEDVQHVGLAYAWNARYTFTFER